MIVVLISDGAAKARPMGPLVLTWTDLRKRSQKLEFPAGSETTCDLDKSRMAAPE
jgi:urease accessory protein UreE